MFPIDITSEQIVIFEIGLICTVVALAAYLLRVLPVKRCRQRCEENASCSDSQSLENASIIVYSNDECSDLEMLLPRLLSQNFPGRYEVIVVNEGDSPQVREAIGMLQIKHPNLYLTHTPDGVRNLSRKKLAITLGVKAARNPIVVLTASTARIESDNWLRRMVQPFESDGVEVVLGYAAPVPYDDTGFGERARSFDFVATAASWIGDAISKRPWRGTEYNLAYRRDLFFHNKGFSKHLNLRYGDDDIFVSEIVNKNNTVVELSEESIVNISGGNLASFMREDATRRRFTQRFIPKRPRLLNIIGSFTYVAAFVAPIVAASLLPYSRWSWIFAGVALLLWYLVGFVWRMAMKSLNGRPLLVTLPFLILTRPIRQGMRSLYAMTHRSKRYSWQ